MSKESKNLESDFVQLARIALTGRAQDVQVLLHRAAKRHRSIAPELADAITTLLREAPTRSSPLRRQAETPMPVDVDSRLHLLRVESAPSLDNEPVLAPAVAKALELLLRERRSQEQLQAVGLEPSKTALFVGPPGVGKTMAARWLARELGRPLIILDLAAVMSSYLGRTGTNLRHVLDYAKSVDCVLLLDELDAIAKRRDDRGEVGELKRLVTVLIQQIDDWPSSGLLVAATNHSDLLDPAIWRRFETKVEFPLPDDKTIQTFVLALLSRYLPNAEAWSGILSIAFRGRSFSEIESEIAAQRRASAVTGSSLNEQLATLVRSDSLSKADRISLAAALVDTGIVSQRAAHQLTGVSRDTIRGRTRNEKSNGKRAIPAE
ncbi:MAG: AAA family ATPase [Gammaproteobacteria bacterium]|nr:AAA family ATPase [Gammaproteobacteria bacterium]